MCEKAFFHMCKRRRTVLHNHVTSRFGARANREPTHKRCHLMSGSAWMICGYVSFIFDDEWSRDGDSSEKWHVKAACCRHRRTEWTDGFVYTPIVTWHMTVTIHRASSKMRSGATWCFFLVTVTIITTTLTKYTWQCAPYNKNRSSPKPHTSAKENMV